MIPLFADVDVSTVAASVSGAILAVATPIGAAAAWWWNRQDKREAMRQDREDKLRKERQDRETAERQAQRQHEAAMMARHEAVVQRFEKVIKEVQRESQQESQRMIALLLEVQKETVTTLGEVSHEVHGLGGAVVDLRAAVVDLRAEVARKVDREEK